MKKKNWIIVKILISICIIFVAIGLTNQSHALVGAIVGVAGIGIILVWIGQVFAVGIALALKSIISLTTAFMQGDGSGTWRMSDILFNKCGATTAGFFNGIGISTEYQSAQVINDICNTVTKWYYIIRNLSIAALLFILLYIGIRMAISTVADKEAKYKKMLIDWTVSLALVFVLHYIMIITFYINNTLVSVLYDVFKANEANFGDWFSLFLNVLVPVGGIDEAIVICGIYVTEFLFFIMYIKRFITLAFLIVIAPLITITYAVDKLGDGKSQALNTWLKEFIFTVIIQPFHCILYLVLILPVIKNMGEANGIGSGILYILMLNFVRQAETIIKKIFNIKADSMPDAGATAAITMGVMSGLLGKAGKGDKDGNETGKKMPKMAEEAGKKAKDGIGKKGDKANQKNVKAKGDNKSDKDKPKYSDKLSQDQIDELKADNIEPGDAEYDQYLRGHGISDSNDAAKEANNTAVAEQNDKEKNKLKDRAKQSFNRFKNTDIGRGAATAWDMFGGVKGAAKVGGAILGASAGLALGDASKAVGLGIAGAAGMGKIESAISGVSNKMDIKDNQEYFAGAVQDYALALAEARGTELTSAQAAQEAAELWQNYQDGGVELSDCDDYEQEFLKMCEKMDDTYSYVGVDDSASAVAETIRMAMNNDIKVSDKYDFKNQ